MGFENIRIMAINIDWNSFFKKKGEKDKNPFPIGSRVYLGYQGDGKTLSLVHYAKTISNIFKTKTFGNVKIKGIKDYKYLESDDDLARALSAPTPQGYSGTLILLDEAHLFFNKKKGIPIEVLSAISQQRKDRKRIVFTSQIWEELDLSIRKQVKEIVKCKRIFNVQINHITDGESLAWNNMKSEWEAKSLGWEIYKHTQELYDSFDTRQRISRNNEYIQRAGGGTTSLTGRLP